MTSRSRRHIVEIQEKVMIYLKLQRYPAAEELLLTSIEEHGPLANLLNLLGLCAHKQSKFSEAIDYFQRAVETNPSFVEASLNLAVTLSDLGFYDSSQKVYQNLQGYLENGQSLPDLLLGRLANLHCKTAVGYEQAGLHERAAEEYNKALQIYPRMPDVRLRLAKLYLRMHSFQDSRQQLLRLLEESDNSPEYLNLLGTVAFRMGDWDEAQMYWQKSQNINPNDKTSRTYLRSAARRSSGTSLSS